MSNEQFIGALVSYDGETIIKFRIEDYQDIGEVTGLALLWGWDGQMMPFEEYKYNPVLDYQERILTPYVEPTSAAERLREALEETEAPKDIKVEVPAT